MGDDRSLPVGDQDVDSDCRATQGFHGLFAGARGDELRQFNAVFTSRFQHFQRCVRRLNPLGERGIDSGQQREEEAHVHLAAAGMEVERALGELGHLGEAAGNGQSFDGMGAEVFE